MIAELGHIALIIAFIVTIIQFIIPMIGAYRNDARLMSFGDRAAIAQFLRSSPFGRVISSLYSFYLKSI